MKYNIVKKLIINLMQQKLTIFGFGYTAQHFAQLLVSQNIQVVATSRQAKIQQTYQSNPKVLDFSKSLANSLLGEADGVLVTIPPLENGQDPSLLAFRESLLQHASCIKWIAYISSTGVYGDYEGGWVDENCALKGKTKTALNRIKSERAWLQLFEENQLPVHIFRAAGIYGAGRSSIDRIKKGKDFTVYHPNHYFSRIHVDDIARALWASFQQPTPGEVFNLCDDLPAPSYVVDEYAKSLLSKELLKRQPLKEANLSPRAQEFYAANRRVSNTKLKKILGFSLAYPDYKAGLNAIAVQKQANS